MATSKSKQPVDTNTEEKIRKAARVVFHKKGFAATRTRDIAEEANINLALLNYYFRSKEKLFELIMLETIATFLQNMGTIFNDENTTLAKKIELVAEKYIDQLIAEPEMPIFVMSEVRSNGGKILEKLPVVNSVMQSAFIKQYKQAVANGEIAVANPLHFVMNIMGLVVFPFVNSPLIKKAGKVSDAQFTQLMKERKKLVPVWIQAMLKAG
ncbi:MAG TPA: TetR/AcrR family transcriptional regulator [Phnomibacter sp.]|nr:TetR/AcrR family transcriptional regulator [Phnomibacter sp.]